MGHDVLNTEKKRKNEKLYGRERNKNGERIIPTKYLTKFLIK